MGKIIKPLFGAVLVGILIYVGLSMVFSAGDKVVGNMNERAKVSNLQSKIESCNTAVAKYKASKKEADRAEAELLCRHSTPEKPKQVVNPSAGVIETLKPWLIVLGVLAALSLLMKSPAKKNKAPWKKPYIEKAESQGQLAITLKKKYEKKRLINNTEEQVYKALLRLIYLHAKGEYRINAQTSLGELLQCDPEGHRTINAKRVDFCLVDKNFMPVAVVEVNGAGHYQGDALERDEVKRAALESAGIKYVAVRESENLLEKLEWEFSVFLGSPRK